jgi:hypothetical protein
MNCYRNRWYNGRYWDMHILGVRSAGVLLVVLAKGDIGIA